MNRLTLGLIAAWMLTSSAACTSMRFTAPEGQSVEESYRGGTEKFPGVRVEDSPSPTARERTIPLMHPPEGFAVYVPQHPDPENRMWIGDHWIYIELSPGGFFAQKVEEGLPQTQGGVDEASARDFSQRLPELKRIAIPWRGGEKP